MTTTKKYNQIFKAIGLLIKLIPMMQFPKQTINQFDQLNMRAESKVKLFTQDQA